MAKITLYEQQYKTASGNIEKHYVWTNEIETKTHIAKDGSGTLTVEDIYDEPVVEVASIGTKMTKPQIQADRKKRSHGDFLKNVLPQFPEGSTERKHFTKKLGKEVTKKF